MDNMTRTGTFITIITGVLSMFIWLTGRAGLPELIFGKEAEKVLPVSGNIALQSNDAGISNKMYNDSLMDVLRQQQASLIAMREKVDSLSQKKGTITDVGSDSEKPEVTGKGSCDLNDVSFVNGSYHITFHSRKSNIYEFNGSISIYTFNGKVEHKGNKLFVINGSGNVYNEMTLVNNCNKLVGTLYTKNGAYPIDVDLEK